MWGVMGSVKTMQIQLNWSANSVNLVSKFSEFGGPFSIFGFVVDIVLSYKRYVLVLFDRLTGASKQPHWYVKISSLACQNRLARTFRAYKMTHQ